MRLLLILALIFILTVTAGCGSSSGLPETQPGSTVPTLSGLPVDGVQPWEQVDGRGYVIPATPQRSASALSPDSHFLPGVERFSEIGLVTDADETSVVVAGSNSLSGGIYRIPLGGIQPGAVAVDVNLHQTAGEPAQYWVGFSNYANDRWEWHGPYSDAQVTKVVAAGGNYLSGLGNFFVAIAGTDEVTFDIVGVTVSPDSAGDLTAPPVPSAPTLASVIGGVELSWSDVIAGDLAGYQIYWSFSPFTMTTNNGVNKLGWLENTTRMVLPVGQARDVYVALSAVDASGNESTLSTVAGPARANAGSALELEVVTPTASAKRNDVLQITASGAASYDFDTDGDGVFDITGSASGTANVETSATGIIRPRVRGTSADGKAVAFGSVSLIVSGNQRPAVSATASPSSGAAPLNVVLDGEADDDGAIAQYAWDFDGDGVFDQTDVSPTANFIFVVPGLYNAKLRATDDEGDWDVDTVAILVTGGSGGAAWVPADPRPDVGSAGGYSSLKVVGGMPAIAYFYMDISFSAGPIKFIRATNAEGTAWGTPVTIDPDGGPGVSMAIVAGNPAIAYYDAPNGDLMYSRASDANGTAWSVPIVLDGAVDDVGQHCTLLIVAGNPAISYMDETNDRLRYIRATTVDGSGWGPAQDVFVAAGNNVGDGARMAIIDGSPAITYFSDHGGFGPQPYYVRATHPTGLAWGTPANITSINMNTIATQTSLIEHNGLPMVAFRDELNQALAVCRSVTLDGAVAWTVQYIDYGEYTGYMVELDKIDDNVVLAYLRALGEMVYRRPATQDAAAWHAAEPIGGFAFAAGMDLEIIAGKPAVTFGHLQLETFSPALAYWRQQ